MPPSRQGQTGEEDNIQEESCHLGLGDHLHRDRHHAGDQCGDRGEEGPHHVPGDSVPGDRHAVHTATLPSGVAVEQEQGGVSDNTGSVLQDNPGSVLLDNIESQYYKIIQGQYY